MLARKTVFGLCAFLAISIQAGSVRAQPMPSEREDAQRIGDLVIANHILARSEHSRRLEPCQHSLGRKPKHFYLSRSVAPALVKPEDIMEYDEDSNPVDARGRALYLERFIHGEVYRARPEVNAVIHSHSPAVIPFSMTGVPLRMAFLLGAFLGSGAPVFEIREAAGTETNMQITDNARGAALAK